MATLLVDDVTVRYESPTGPVEGLRPTSFAADAGEILLVGGPSGSGKTTLLSSLGGILRPTGGRVVVDGTDVTSLRGRALTTFRRRTIGFVFQDFNLVASLDATENVCVPLRADRWRGSRARARAEELLDGLGLSDRRHHRPDQLSGGQQQRVAIARALALEPSVLVADEPTANLDVESAEVVISLLLAERERGRIVVMATHDARLRAIADRVVDLARTAAPPSDGPRTVALRPGEILFAQGDAADVAYRVERGALDLVRTESDGTERVLRRCYPGEHFGELGPLLGAPRSAAAKAVVRSVVTAVGIAELRDARTPTTGTEGPC